MIQLNPTIPVLCKDHGYGNAFIISDVSIDVNPIYHVRFPGGIVKHFYSDDIRIVGNPMDGSGWDVKEFDTVNKIPADAKRHTEFLKESNNMGSFIYLIRLRYKNERYCIYYKGHTDTLIQYTTHVTESKKFKTLGEVCTAINKLKDIKSFYSEYTEAEVVTCFEPKLFETD
jgi:hypothetical protein